MKAGTPAAESPAMVEVLAKGAKILELLADFPSGLSLADISRRSGIAKTTTHRLLITWEHLGYIQHHASGHFQLGAGALELSRKVSRRNRIADTARPLLERLQRATGETVFLGVYRGGRVVLIDGLESQHPLRIVVDLGSQCYLHASAQGRAVAAFLDPSRLAELILANGLQRITPATRTEPSIFTERLMDVRRCGYAINWEETVEGSVCIGAAFFAGTGGPVLGSLGVSIPVSRATESHVQTAIGSLRMLSRNLSEMLVGVTAEADAKSPREVCGSNQPPFPELSGPETPDLGATH
jgi:DNA-binding IclR family transcriptional regulator